MHYSIVNKLLNILLYLQVFSSAKYPASDVRSDYHSIFSSDVPLHFGRCLPKIRSKHMPLEGKVLQVIMFPLSLFLQLDDAQCLK